MQSQINRLTKYGGYQITSKKAIFDYVKEDSDIDKKAREKVASLKRGVMEGSPEWDIMYKKYYEEERNRHGK